MEYVPSDVMLSYAWWQPQVRGKILKLWEEQVHPFLGEQPPSAFSAAAHEVLESRETSLVSCSGFNLEWITYESGSKTFATPVPHWHWFIATRNWLYRGGFVTRNIQLGPLQRGMLSASEPHPYFPIPEVSYFNRISYDQIWATAYQSLEFPAESEKYSVPVYMNYRLRPDEFGYGGVGLGNLQGTFAGTYEDYYFFDENCFHLQQAILDAQLEIQQSGSGPSNVAAVVSPDSSSLVDQLKGLAELLQSGVLSQDEFDIAKARVLRG